MENQAKYIRGAIYTRVSKEEVMQGYSLEDQARMCREYIAKIHRSGARGYKQMHKYKGGNSREKDRSLQTGFNPGASKGGLFPR